MISAVGVAILLGLLIAFLIKSKVLRVSGAIICILFGLVLGVTPIGHPVEQAMTGAGSWLWAQVTRL